MRRNSKFASATQMLAFSEMTLFSNRGRWTLNEARCIEQFIGLRSDIALLSLASYFAELAEAVADEDSPNPELLPLCLNALFALGEGLKQPEYVKPAFELRLMAIAGFEPLMDYCARCEEREPRRAYLDAAGGTILCSGCSPLGGHELTLGALHAARYIIGCDSKKLYSFKLGDVALRELSAAAENYVLAHLDRKFRTLDYYNAVCGPQRARN